MPRKYKILLRQGTGASVIPTAANFDIGEPAWNSTDGKLYIKNAEGAMIEVGNIPDGSIATAKLADRSVTNAKIGSGRQLVGQFTTNGTQNVFTITAPAHLNGAIRWGFDWRMLNGYSNNNQSIIYIRINNRTANDSYTSTGTRVNDGFAANTSPINIDWSSIWSGNWLALMIVDSSGQNLGEGTGGLFECSQKMWTSHATRHIANVRLTDLIYQTGRIANGTEGLQSISFGSFSRDANAASLFPSGFSVTVWAETYS